MQFSVDNQDTQAVKEYAVQTLRADLVGVANIERFSGAPLMMSPQGILPEARSVIVLGLHHPDAAIERGGLRHPQEIGPYVIQYHINWRLDDLSYRMAMFLEKMGYRAVGIASSNIWRYRGYRDLQEQFAPDVSHMHCAVAAGLAEFGYNGLAITPEFGARVRYVTVITDAVLTPSPLLEPGSVCDRCMLCRKECRSGALSKELNGYKTVRIEDKEYRYADKNLWRCAWGEHFDLDLDLPIPEHVDEEVIMAETRKHARRGGEMGSCLRYCVPHELRTWERDYTNAPRRLRHFLPNPAVESWHRGLFEKLRGMAADWGVDHVVVSSAERLRREMGIELESILPHSRAAVTLIASRRRSQHTVSGEANAHTHQFVTFWEPLAAQAGYDMVRLLESLGYSSCQFLDFPEEALQEKLRQGLPEDRELLTATFLTEAPLPETGWNWSESGVAAGPEMLKRRLRLEMERMECDLFGVSDAGRLEAVVPELRPHYDGEEEIVVRNKAEDIYKPYDPEVSVVRRRVTGPGDFLPGAKSVIVIGLPLPEGNVDIVARTPAEAVGPYVFAQYECIWRLRVLSWKLMGLLERAGFRAVCTTDLSGTGSVSMNPRGEMPDFFCNTFAAVAAGLGMIAVNGSVVNPHYGNNVRYMAIVTDAELPPDPVLPNTVAARCEGCDGHCLEQCPTAAFAGEIRVTVGGVPQHYRKLDVNRCNWAKRYSLVGSEGSRYTGWTLDIPCPRKITPENLSEALRQLPQIEKIRPCTFEQCVFSCAFCRPEKR